MNLKIVYFSNKPLATAEAVVSAWNISNAFSSLLQEEIQHELC